MFVKIRSSTVMGIAASPIIVEVDVACGLPQFSTVGLPDAAVKESRDRIRAAIKNSGYHFPRNHVTVNLAPADIKKEGTGFDLPIAMGILAAQGVLNPEAIGDLVVAGELSLDGGVKGICGVLQATFEAREAGLRGIIVPEENVAEAAIVSGIDIFPVSTLAQAVEQLNGTRPAVPFPQNNGDIRPWEQAFPRDFSEIKGQNHVKRALEIAAAGGHNLLMIGPPGSGKTMLAERLGSILPPLTLEEAIETTKIFSVAGLLDRKKPLLTDRPFRAPHHSISDAGLVGGGHQPKPGEISLAHNGVLFLDEFPEFKKHVLESLRQPLESGYITITRAAGFASYPARFMLVAAMNPCPCGYFGDSAHPCRCSTQTIRQYQGRISGPLLDRIDMHVEVPRLAYRDLSGACPGESSAGIRERVVRAREAQRRRGGGAAPVNAALADRQVREICLLDGESRGLIEMAMDKLGLSARSYTRILKLARTIADLAAEGNIQSSHVAEAIHLRNLDRRLI